MKRFFAWLWAVVRWLAEPQWFWIALLVLLVAFWVSFRPGTCELQVRLSGLALQCLGVGIVAFDLYRTRKLFGRLGIATTVKAWCSRFPHWRGKAVPGTARISGRGALTAQGRPWSEVITSTSLAAQVDALTTKVEWLRKLLVAAEADRHSLARKQDDALQSEQQLRADHDEKLGALLESAETGGLHISFVGLIWLLFGILLSSVPGEIAQGFQ